MARARWMPYAGVMLLAAGIYLHTLGFGFVFDDDYLVATNGFLREPWSPVLAFFHHFWHGTPVTANYYRPIVVSSLALNGRILGWSPAGFHLFNVLLHAANAALLLALARRLGMTGWTAPAAAALFAAHPAAAWPVASIVARVDLLPALFVLLAWMVYARPPGGDGGVLRHGLEPVVLFGFLVLLALLCKESAVAFLAVPLLGMRRTGPSGSRGGPSESAPAGRYLVAGLMALIAYLGFRTGGGVDLAIHRETIDPVTNPLAHLPFPARLPAALALAGRYALYLPAPAGFGDPNDYRGPEGLPSFTHPDVLAGSFLLAAWALAVAVLWWRRDRIAVPLGFALAAFLPASNLLVPIASLYALNFLYLPLVGFSLAVGGALERRPGARRRADGAGTGPPGWAWVAVPLVGMLALASAREAGIWRDGRSLFSAWTGRFPNYALAHSRLGVHLLAQGDRQAAIGALRKALSISDLSGEAHYNLGLALLLTSGDRASLEEALGHTRRSLELVPDFLQARLSETKILLRLERPAEAEEAAREALGLDPGLPAARIHLAAALARQGRHGEAAAELRDLARRYESDATVRSLLIQSLIEARDLDGARREAEAAGTAFPAMPWFDFCRARVEALGGRREKAMALLRAALSGDPAARDWIRRAREFDAYRGSPDFERLLREK